jgi:type III pantothenate kinase
LDQWQAGGAVIAGSNPKALDRVLDGWGQTNLPSPLAIRDRSLVPVALDVDYPDKVGIDRLLGAVAANTLKPRNRPVIIVDSGTATTVNFISGEGVFCGGAILPGLEMSAKALNHYTAVLPFIPVQELGGELPQAPGRNTREAIRNGLYWGQVGAIRELIRQTCLSRQLSDPVNGIRTDDPNSPWLILTGGGGPVLSQQFPGVLSIPSLGMHGLVITAWNQGL